MRDRNLREEVINKAQLLSLIPIFLSSIKLIVYQKTIAATHIRYSRLQSCLFTGRKSLRQSIYAQQDLKDGEKVCGLPSPRL